MRSRETVWAALLVACFAMVGCKQHTNEAAIAQAKLLAAQSGVAQQVVWTDIAGNTTTVVIQPPSPGSANQLVKRTVSNSPGDPRVLAPVTNSAAGPVISPYVKDSKTSGLR